MGQPFTKTVELVDEASHEKIITFIEEAMLYGKTHFMGTHTMLRKKTGEEFPISDSAAPIFNAQGTVDGAIIIFRDNAIARELEKSREEFSSLATHQLRAPITIINQYAELLTNEASLSVLGREEVGAIKKASNSLAELVNAMLNVSRIETGTIGIFPQSIFLPNVSEEMVKEMTPQFTAKKLRVETVYGKDVPAINADEKLFGAICKNLLSNALKFTPMGGKITLSINKNATDVVLSVVDTGIGIPKSEQAKMFTKFFRAENAIGAEISGTGLGLYTIKAILKQSGGNIWFESTEGLGASFHVSIPLTGMRKHEGLKGLT